MEQTNNPARHFALQKIYVKDASFEAPNSPAVFQENWQPQVNLNLASAARDVGEDLKEVILTVTVAAKDKERTAFLIEVQQAGLFAVKDFSEQELGPLLGAYCPAILFPYAREVVSELTSKGGFPPVLLQPVNFDELYTRHVQQQKTSVAAADIKGHA